MSAPLDTISPLTYTTWLKYQNSFNSTNLEHLYTEYLHEWYSLNTIQQSENKNLIKENYIQLLKDLSFLFGKEEKDLFLSQLDYKNDEELIITIPYFVKKLKEICKVLSNKRETIKNSKLRFGLIGSNYGLETLLYEYLLKGFTRDENYISQVPVSSLSKYFPSLSAVNGNFFVELEELHDSQSYHDSDPTVSPNQYVNVSLLENEIPFEGLNDEEILGLISTRFLSKVADTPLSRLFNQYLSEIPTLSTAALLNPANALVYNQIAASQKYLGGNIYGLTAVRNSEVFTPDTILDIDISIGNNWFYFPSGDKIVDESSFNNVFNTIKINDSSFFKSGATGGDDYRNSDLIFTEKSGVAEGAWFEGVKTDYVNDTMRIVVNAKTTKEFIFPFPGFKVNSKGNLWGGYLITDDNKYDYERLSPEQKKVLLTEYYSNTLPNSSSESIYINDSDIVYSNAYASKFSDTADTITKVTRTQNINPVYNIKVNGSELEESYLFRFDTTDFAVSIGSTDIIWPIGAFNFDNNVPITVLNDTCLPILLRELDVSNVMTGAIAGTDFNTSDVIYKINTRTGDPIEAAWLGSSPVQYLDIYDTIPVYDTPAKYCASYLEGNIQGSLSIKVNPKKKVSFIWMDEDTPADKVIFYREHAEDCPYLKKSPHNYYKNQDYQNPSPLRDLTAWTKCRCKSVIFSPIGHEGDEPTDYNLMTDLLFADPQGLGEDFAINSWMDTRANDPYSSPQFAFYKLDGESGDKQVGWGTGKWKTPTGNEMILKTGRRYTYYRTSLRDDITPQEQQTNFPIPYIVVNYPYRNLRGAYSYDKYDICVVIDKSLSQKLVIDTVKQIVDQFTKSILVGFNASVQISLISFNVNATIHTFLTENSEIIRYNLTNITIQETFPEYTTNLYDSLVLSDYILSNIIIDNEVTTDASYKKIYYLCESLNAKIEKAGSFTTTNNIPRPDAKKVIVVFSDGYQNVETEKTIPFAKKLMNKGTDIYSISIGYNSLYTDVMQKITKRTNYFSLQQYLASGDGNSGTFVQYLLSRFSDSKLSVMPTWYKAIRGTDGLWTTSTEISDMILHPGDYFTYVHREKSSYTGPNNTSFDIESISFAFNARLYGWDYTTNTFSVSALGIYSGAKPFWGKSYTAPDLENIDTHFDKQLATFGGQLRFVNEYVPIHQPELSTTILSSGDLLEYKRRGEDNLVWNQPLTFVVTTPSYTWKKIYFSKEISNLEDLFRNNNPVDLIAYASQEPSQLTLESYSSFLPSKYNYYARSPFKYTENLFYKNKCLTSFAVFNTGIAIEASDPYANLDNINYPTVANISFPSLAVTEKETGKYLLPENLGVSHWRGRGYTIVPSGDTLSFIDSISAERLYTDVNKYGPRNRGLTKKDQITPVEIKDIDNRWMMESFSSSSAAGRITDVPNNQKFTPYQSTYEITKKNALGLSRQNDDFEFWTFPLPSTWDYPEKYPLTFRKELLASSYEARQKELLIDKGDIVQWNSDIFGNEYGLIKELPTSSETLDNIELPPSRFSM